MAFNKVFLLGNVGADPKVRTFADGGISATFTLATSFWSFTTKSGHTIPARTEWHNVNCQGGIAKVVEKFVHKGDKVFVEGRLRNRKFKGKDGQDHYLTEVLVEQLELIGAAAKGAADSLPVDNASNAQNQNGERLTDSVGLSLGAGKDHNEGVEFPPESDDLSFL